MKRESGHLAGNAHVVGFRNCVAFLPAAVIHVNANGIHNGNVYEYAEIGLPFLREENTFPISPR